MSVVVGVGVCARMVVVMQARAASASRVLVRPRVRMGMAQGAVMVHVAFDQLVGCRGHVASA